MHSSPLRSPWIIFSFIVLFCSACAETKVSQCNRLVSQLNPIKTIKVPDTPQTQLVSAAMLEEITAKVEAELITDAEISNLSQKITTHLKEVSGLLRQASEASTKQNKVELTKLIQTTQDLIKQDTQLVQDLNAYCAD